MTLISKTPEYLSGFQIPSGLYIGSFSNDAELLEFFKGVRDAATKMVVVLQEAEAVKLLKGDTSV